MWYTNLMNHDHISKHLELLATIIEDYRDRLDALAAEEAMADEADEIIPFRRTTPEPPVWWGD